VAPIPAQILAAKKIFVANAGGDEWAYTEGPFGGPDRAYNQLFSALKAWGRCELVSAPADADLTFEIQFTVPAVEHQLFREGLGATEVVPFDPQFRLVIRDARTNALLWGITEHIQWAVLQENREKNFDQAMAKIVDEVRALAGQSTTALKDPKP